MFIPEYSLRKNIITYPDCSFEYVRYYLGVYKRALVYSTPNEVDVFEAAYKDVTFWLLPNDYACHGYKRYFAILNPQ